MKKGDDGDLGQGRYSQSSATRYQFVASQVIDLLWSRKVRFVRFSFIHLVWIFSASTIVKAFELRTVEFLLQGACQFEKQGELKLAADLVKSSVDFVM